jgi:phosphoribosyl-AMP cyclohydrolase
MKEDRGDKSYQNEHIFYYSRAKKRLKSKGKMEPIG